MTTPYWGQLPGSGSKPTSQTKGRRLSDDYDPTDRRYSLDAPVQPQTKANRVSVRTTNTEAPTESTLSPYASPTAASFQEQGLAPRPPSFQYGGNQYPGEAGERRRSRKSQEPEDEFEDLGSEPPPAAPDVPRAPPVSFRHPYGNGALPYTYPAAAGIPRGARKSEPLSPADEMDPEEFYKSAPTNGREKVESSARDQPRAFILGSGSRRRSAAGGDATPGRIGSQKEPVDGRQHERRSSTDPSAQNRRPSASGQSESRRKLADDRSPLQRLELTLDSITKEEKRARVEAAEQLARERETRQSERPVNQQVRFREGGPPSSQEARKVSAPQPEIAVHKGPLTQNPPEEGKRYGSVSGKSPRTRAPDSKIPVPSPQSSGIPQRNLSFRERAERDDLKLPRANGADDHSPTSPSAGIPLTRSGSNKLKKEPPGDPWFNRRLEAEKKYPTVQSRSGPAIESPDSEIPTPTARPIAGSVRNKAPAPEKPRVPSAPVPPVAARDDVARQAPAKLTKSPSQRKQGVTSGASPPGPGRRGGDEDNVKPSRAVVAVASAGAAAVAAGAVPTRRAARHRGSDDDDSDSGDGFGQHHHRITNLVYSARDNLKPGQGMYKPPQYLDEWKKATVGTLSGALLDLGEEPVPRPDEKDKTWWESPSRRTGSVSSSSRPMKAEAFDGEYDETNAPTRFKPPLYLKCGPLLRFCGTRTERVPTRSNRNGIATEREIWRGTVMIVTRDAESSYDIAPTLRMFLQPIDLLPPPPAEIQGALPPEYVDPIAGLPKLGRKGETIYVRPVDHLEEATDLSRDETDEGLFEKIRSPSDESNGNGAADPHGSFAARRKRIHLDGEKVTKYKDVRGFRLHSERGLTFWRFNIEVELREKQQRIAYRINRGPSTGFWVPGRGQSMNIMFHSCNGFSMSVNPDLFSGPDPMWRDVLNTHQTQPFHVMIGGGDQIYNDAVIGQTRMFQDWLMMKNPLHKHNAPFTTELQDELEGFYLERYCMWFSQGLFGLANSQIPMVNMYDDHDIIDGFGSYPNHFMNSPVFSGLGNVAFKYYMLFQHQSVPDETEATEPSWTLGSRPGPYINELSRSLFMFLGTKVALLAVDCRTERKRDEVLREETWKRVMDRCYAEIAKGKTEHLLVLLGVPIAYPRLVWLENILTSRLMDPIKALGKTGMFGNFLNRFDGGVEVLDDLDDHWTAKDHKDERRVVIEDLQDLAADKSIRVTILSGDVHLAAVGQFYSNAKLGLSKHKDFRYMPNVISSAIVNTPPPDLMADILNKRNKVHHFDKETDEDMIPIFSHGVEGKPRNNKHLLPHRNWCSIREYQPGSTPPHTPNHSTYDITPPGTPPGGKGGILRRLSLSKSRRGPTFRPDASRPPLSAGMMRSFSRGRVSTDNVRPERPAGGARTLSLTRGDFKPGNIFRRLSGRARKQDPDDGPDDGGINGQWGPDSEGEADLPPAAAKRLGIGGQAKRRGKAPDPYEIDDDMDSEDDHDAPPPASFRRVGLRGGGGSYEEFEDGDESYFTAKPRRGQAPPPDEISTPGSAFVPKPFHRTPTGLSAKQMKRAEEYEVNLEGGLEVCLNVEVNQKDPAGITVPYRFVVPRLFYQYQGEEPVTEKPPTGFKRWISLRRGKSVSEKPPSPEEEEEEDDFDEEEEEEPEPRAAERRG